MDIIKKIELKGDWDVVGTIKDTKGCCPIIENGGTEALSEFINRKNSGSFLLSGQRGSGKTTSLIHILRKVDRKKCLVIYLNAIYLEAVNGSSNLGDLLQILKLLIRSLILELESESYNISSELKELLLDLRATEIEWLNKRSITSSAGYTVSGSATMSGEAQATNLGSKASLESNIDYNHLSGLDYSKLSRKTGYSVEDLADKFATVTSNIEKGKLNRGFIARYEKMPLPWPKRIEVPNFKNKKSIISKIIFVLDELDTYDKKPTEILDIIKKFKNLFTLSKAQFIFVVGENTYNTVLTEDTYKTIFTEKYFLPKPDGDSLSKYLDSIVKEEYLEPNIDWQKLKWFLIFRSKHNFYQLTQEIRSFTKYYLETNKVYIELDGSSFTGSVQASIHYAMNEIYKYFVNQRTYRHYDNVLFQELTKVEDSYLDCVQNQKNGVQTISLADDTQLPIDLNIKIKNAKISLLRYLHLLANVPIAKNYGLGQSGVPADWQALSVGLSDFNTVMKGVRGPVTTAETELIETVKEVKNNLELLNKSLSSNPQDDLSLSSLITSFSNNVSFNYPKESVELIEDIVKQINTKLLFERDAEETNNALNLIKNLKSLLDGYSSAKTGDYVVKTDWGNITTNSVEIAFGNDSSHGNKLLSRATIFTPTIIKNHHQITLKVNIQPDSLINFLITTEYTGSETNDEFYMARVDTRKETSTYSILYKPAGSLSWNPISNSPIGSVSKIRPNEWIEIKIEIIDGKIILSQKTNKNFVKSAEVTCGKPIKNFGLANEVGEVKIKDLSFK